MASYCNSVITGETLDLSASADVLAPLVSGMELEGNYAMKKPCYTSDEVNPPDATCLHGSPWMTNYAVHEFVGEFENPNVSLVVDDNFHRSGSLFPYHHPKIEQSCAGTVSSKCSVEVITNTMNTYHRLEEHIDTGKSPMAAKEMRAKMKSIQAYRIAAGEDV